MLYLIGLGLNENGISKEGIEAIAKCKKIYLENYTVEFPYPVGFLNEVINKKIFQADRELVESLSIIDEARRMNVALLVYGSPLTATTHTALIQEANNLGVKWKIVYSSSILDAIAETGLQLYKFGRIASLPTWKENYNPTSFVEVIKNNQSINAHTLILMDIGLEFGKAIEKLDEIFKSSEVKTESIVVCSRLGNDTSRIYYGEMKSFVNGFKDENGKLRDIKNKIKSPFCVIIPSKLHFLEKDILEIYQI